MNSFWTTARRAAVIATVAAAPLTLTGVVHAQAAETGSISGVVWHDLDSDGVRDEGEPGIADHSVVLTTVSKTWVEYSGPNGEYTFKDMPFGVYSLRSTHRLGVGQSWSPMVTGGSRFLPSSGEMTSPLEVSVEFPEQTGFDSGFVTGDNDYRAAEIVVEGPQRETYQVGDELRITGKVVMDGNAHDRFGAKLVLPDGLRRVERLGDLPQAGGLEVPNELRGWFNDVRAPGTAATLGAKVVVEKPVSAAEIRLQVLKGHFDASDNTADDVRTLAFSAVAAPVAVVAPVATATGTTTSAPSTTTGKQAVTQAGAKTEDLADTGVSTLGLIGLGGVLLAGGGAALWVLRRRKA